MLQFTIVLISIVASVFILALVFFGIHLWIRGVLQRRGSPDEIERRIRRRCRLGIHEWGELRRMYFFHVADRLGLKSRFLSDFKDTSNRELQDRLCIRCGKRDNEIEREVKRYEKFVAEKERLSEIAKSFGHETGLVSEHAIEIESK